MTTVSAPRVTVVTPFYNAEAHLAETIESVLQQSYEAFEYILVNDGSKDGSAQVVEAYCKRFPDRVRMIAHDGEINKGVAASRNLGVRAARGEFIAPLDADDIWFPEKLAFQVELLDRFPEVALTCGAAIYWQSWNGGEDRLVRSGPIQDCVVGPPVTSLEMYPLGGGCAPCPSDWLLRKSAVEAVGGWEEQFAGPRALFEDQAFLAKLYVDYPVYFSDRTLLKYRLHGNSITAAVASAGEKLSVKLFFFNWLVRFLRARLNPRSPVLRKAKRQRSQLRRDHLNARVRRVLRLAKRRLGTTILKR